MGQSRATVTLENVVERASGAEEHEEKVSVRGVGTMEERENVLVREGSPYRCLVFKSLAGL